MYCTTRTIIIIVLVLVLVQLYSTQELQYCKNHFFFFSFYLLVFFLLFTFYFLLQLIYSSQLQTVTVTVFIYLYLLFIRSYLTDHNIIKKYYFLSNSGDTYFQSQIKYTQSINSEDFTSTAHCIGSFSIAIVN